MTHNFTITLNNGISMPGLGFGVFQVEKAMTEQSVRWALEAGYRHIDTASIYGNETEVGRAVQTCGLPRHEIFVTTKLWNEDMRQGRQMQAFEASLAALGLDYIDLYLIHWPVENFIESWLVMENILASGRAKAIGVSNFKRHHLESLLKEANVVPAVNQIESHPYLTQADLYAYCAGLGIAGQSWKSLGGQGAPLLTDPVLVELGRHHGKTPAQIILRWNLQRGVTPLVRSIKQERIISNYDIFDFSLTVEDMQRIAALNQDKRYGADPDTFDF